MPTLPRPLTGGSELSLSSQLPQFRSRRRRRTSTSSPPSTQSIGRPDVLPRRLPRPRLTNTPETSPVMSPRAAPVKCNPSLASSPLENELGIDQATPTPTNPLACQAHVHFETGIVEMVGSACTVTSYSLPGSVHLTLPTLPAELDDRHRVLKDLTVKCEGKAEYWDSSGRYTPLRLFASTLPLIADHAPQIIPSRVPGVGDDKTVTVAIPFDLRIPGWLPPTLTSSFTAVSYGLEVDTEIVWSQQHGDLMETSLDAQLNETSSKSTSSFTPFIVRRHRIPTVASPDQPRSRKKIFERDCHSVQLGKRLDFVIALSDWVDVNGKNLEFGIRLRVRDDQHNGSGSDTTVAPDKHQRPHSPSIGTTDNPRVQSGASSAKTCKVESKFLTHIRELGTDVHETGTFYSSPLPSFMALFPLPEEQPSNSREGYPLLGPTSRPSHHVSHLAGSAKNNTLHKTTLTRPCLLSDTGIQRRFRFSSEKGVSTSWRRISFVLPMPVPPEPSSATRPIPDSESPFLRLKHTLNIYIVLQAPGFTEPEVIVLDVPLRFGTTLQTSPRPASEGPPPYTTIFHDNGEARDCDPLPLYTESLSGFVNNSCIRTAAASVLAVDRHGESVDSPSARGVAVLSACVPSIPAIPSIPSCSPHQHSNVCV